MSGGWRGGGSLGVATQPMNLQNKQDYNNTIITKETTNKEERERERERESCEFL